MPASRTAHFSQKAVVAASVLCGILIGYAPGIIPVNHQPPQANEPKDIMCGAQGGSSLMQRTVHTDEGDAHETLQQSATLFSGLLLGILRVVPSLTDLQFVDPVPWPKHDRQRLDSTSPVLMVAHGEATVKSEPLPEVKDSKSPSNDLLGDALEPSSVKHKHSNSYVALLFFHLTLLLGVTILYFIERYCPMIPYTSSLFLAGCIIECIQHNYPKDGPFYWESWHTSMDMWEAINPHMIIYAFSPALIFAWAMQLNFQLVSKCFWQIFLLAGPGVVFGTVASATFSVYVLPYGWGWSLSLVFGAVLSATDPVAVVALCNSLGVSPRLRVLISGESLMNDGTAMVIFILMMKVSLGAQVDAYDFLLYFLHMSLTSVVCGLVIGRLAISFIGLCAEESYHADMTIQVIVTIFSAFLTFFLAEACLSTSGVLATATCGAVIGTYGWPRFVCSETMHTVWETIEFIANTVICFLGGLLFANLCMSRTEHITRTDVFFLFALFIFVLFVRLVMVALLWLPLNYMGTKLEFTEGAIIVGSGVRGVIALSMAIIVDMEPEIPHVVGSRMMFLVGGLVGLTMVVNATIMVPILTKFGHTRTDKVKQRILEQYTKTIEHKTHEAFTALIKGHEAKTDLRFKGANLNMVRAMVPALDRAEFRNQNSKLITPLHSESQQSADMLKRYYREVFLRILESHYWEAIREGLVKRTCYQTRLLLRSVQEAHDDLTSLGDWSSIEDRLKLAHFCSFGSGDAPLGNQEHVSKIPRAWRLINSVIDTQRLVGLLPTSLTHRFFRASMADRYATLVLTFLEAHRKAQKEVFEFLGTGDAIDKQCEDEVVAESQAECEKAKSFLKVGVLDVADIGELASSRMLARKFMQLQTEHISHLREMGILSEGEASDMERTVVHSALRRLVNAPIKQWLDAKESVSDDSKESVSDDDDSKESSGLSPAFASLAQSSPDVTDASYQHLSR